MPAKTPVNRKKDTILLITILSVALSSIALLIWWSQWNPVMLDGPFTGVPAKLCPQSEPDQVFPIGGGKFLAVHDPRTGEPALTVALRAENEEAIWCISAVAYDGTVVHKLRFTDHKQYPSETRVRGSVDWTYGREAMLWFVDADGRNRRYWYSW